MHKMRNKLHLCHSAAPWIVTAGALTEKPRALGIARIGTARMKMGSQHQQRKRRPVVTAAASGGPPLLYIDVLNFQSFFFDGDILEKRQPGYEIYGCPRTAVCLNAT
jgi:hypothetical protein